MPNLETLDVSGTKIGDAGILQLKTSKTLRSLNCRDTKVTRDAVNQLQKSLPNCAISH